MLDAPPSPGTYVPSWHVSAGRMTGYTQSPGAALERKAADRAEKSEPANVDSEPPLMAAFIKVSDGK